MERYEVVLRSFHRIPAALSADLRANVYPVILQKHEVIHADSEAVDGIFFIEKGLVQYFNFFAKKKRIARFKSDDEFIIADREVVSAGTMQVIAFEALEDTLLWNFPASLLQELYEKHLIFNRHSQIIMLKDIVHMEESHECHRQENHPRNYFVLRQTFPHLLNRVPIPNLANFTRLSEAVFKRLHSGNKLKRH